MSTVQSYEFQASPEQRMRAQLEIENRHLELVRLQIQRRTEVIEAALGTTAAQAEETRQELKALASALDVVARQLSDERQRLAACRKNTKRLSQAVEGEVTALRAAVKAGNAALRHADAIANAAGKTAEAIGQAEASRAGKLSALDDEVSQLRHQLDMVLRNPACAVPAIATLTGMEELGYRLSKVPDTEELLVEFVRDGARIAVRLQAAERKGDDAAVWNALLDTEGMTGAACLEELDDFDTAVINLDFGDLQRGNIRLYPKPSDAAQTEGIKEEWRVRENRRRGTA
ncbi:MAG: hypothetical protein K2Q10_00145 [Rhodospirillales bacterium]|nr:hypothetical protein [Rhodospirillales bacterium]